MLERLNGISVRGEANKTRESLLLKDPMANQQSFVVLLRL